MAAATGSVRGSAQTVDICLHPQAKKKPWPPSRLIATLPNSEFDLTHSKRIELIFSNRNNIDVFSSRIFYASQCLGTQSPLLRCSIDTRRSSFVTGPAHHAKLSANSMPARGKFIVLEGIDGSGKRTQLEMLAHALDSRKIQHTQVSFPRYDGFFGKLVARFLNGEFGPLDAVDAHFSALLYAGDRLEAKPKIEADLAAGRIVIADRYIGSNLAHQTARAAPAKRGEFLDWLKQLEYEIYALPPEDLVIYLRVPPAEAQRLVGQKGERDYTKLRRDLLESDIAHLQAASDVYDGLAKQPNWKKIDCFDAAVNELRAPEEIHREVLAAVEARIFPALHANR